MKEIFRHVKESVTLYFPFLTKGFKTKTSPLTETGLGVGVVWSVRERHKFLYGP